MIQVFFETAKHTVPTIYYTVIYTVNHKQRDILFFTITLANLNHFL